MRIKKPKSSIHEGDLTPMIDMTFQLIAFFMVLINFTESQQDQRIQLPESTLAKPPEAVLEAPITIHLMENGNIVLAGHELPLEGLAPYLIKEANVLRMNNKSPSDATVIIRAHRWAETGKVQELIKVCQENRFDTFALCAKEELE